MKTKQIKPKKCTNCKGCFCNKNIMAGDLYYTYGKLYGHKDCTSLTLSHGVVTYLAKGRTVKRKITKTLEETLLRFLKVRV